PATTRHVAELSRFTVGGGWLWHRPIPGATDEDVGAPPNILRAQGQDVILLPTGAGFHVFLTALSADTGAVLARQTVSSRVPSTSGGASWDDIACLLLACFSLDLPPPPPQHLLPADVKRPFPGVAVHTPSDGGPPLILMSDGLHDLMGFGFTGNGFEERFRIHDEKRVLTSTPNAWPDGHVMIATAAGDDKYEVVYAGAGLSTIRAITGQLTYAAPTALGGSRHAMVNMHGGVTFMSGVTKLGSVSLPGQSIAAAAASRNHVFVSTASALYTFDKATLKQLTEFSWSRGGLSQPVIGPQGHVYAIAANTLYVFPPPRVVSDGQLPDVGTVPVLQATDAPQPLPPPSGGTSSGSLPADRTMPRLGSSTEIQQAETAAVDPQSMPEIEADLPTRTYKPPLTAAGNRLFACLELDGDNCGNSQMRKVAENFCQAQGFIRAEDLDVDSRRGVAETLDGRLCSKKKCKVFDWIVCRK
ncbi:MAG TPA: hypothetical protein VJV39_16490, partial [Dongiaceae bacterium]|nr:hypothetical protein [Dongiaceae bacterium]